MGILNVDHPDIKRFINYKSYPSPKNRRIVKEIDSALGGTTCEGLGTDIVQRILTDNQLTHFNISVGISDAFMEAVKNDTEWSLTSRVDGSTVKTVNARELLRLIAESAWRSGDPGVIFLDRMEEDNMVPYLGKLEATNPCFVYETKILTSEGYREIGSLENQTVDFINADGKISRGKVWYSGQKETVNLRLSTGKTIQCTPNHVFQTVGFEEVSAEDSKGTQLMPYLKYPELDDEYTFYGFIQGDGQLARLNSDIHRGLEVYIGDNDEDVKFLLDTLGYAYTEPDKPSTYYVQGLNERLIELGFNPTNLSERVFPSTYDSWTAEKKASFLRGCFSANGSIVGTRGRITYKSTSRKFIDQLQETLLNDFDIDSYVTTNKPTDVEFSNGTYTTRESYDLNIGRFSEKVKFYNTINYIHNYKRAKLESFIYLTAPYVTSVTPAGKQHVYDFSEPLTNWGVVEGVVAHNCSEVTLLPNEPCCLGSINLSAMVEDGLVSEEKLAYVTTIATRFLDDVHVVNETPIEKINQAAKNTRRLGLGVMGWSDLLVQTGVPYDSEESLKLAEVVMRTIQSVAWGTSQYLAQERGTFAAWDKEKVKNIIPHLYDELPEMRNVAVTSLAPTGSIALLVDVNGGIEPFFALAYTRYITEGVGNIPTSKIVEFNSHLASYLETLDAEDKEKIEGHIKETGVLPDGLDDNAREVFKTAGEISWRDHIKVQATFQKYVDNAISKTINMPEDSTVEDVMEAYIYAWEMGLKSVALYRDNSKNFQILNK